MLVTGLVNAGGTAGIFALSVPEYICILGFFYAQPHAEEICRRSGAWGARRVGEKVIPLLDCTRASRWSLSAEADECPARE